MVQYIGIARTEDWLAFYKQLFGIEAIPREQRFGIMPAGTLLRAPALSPGHRFMLQMIEPETGFLDYADAGERLQRLGLGVPDVPAAVKALRALGIEFMETGAVHTERRGAITKTYLGSVVFELVHSEPEPA